ncbi:TetR/AcrR family transcriptional regulator, partial [Vibrio sp. 10N.222.49.E5]
QRDDLASELFLLHEGVSSAWPVLGEEAVTSAQNMVTKLLKETR